MLLQETITGTFIDPPGPGFPVLGEGGKCPSFGSPQGRDILEFVGDWYCGAGK